MPASVVSRSFICSSCLRAARDRGASTLCLRVRTVATVHRLYSESAVQRNTKEEHIQHERAGNNLGGSSRGKDGAEEGAMTRRLRGMSEEAVETGDRSARKAVGEAGFSEDLKRQLEDRIASASFRADNRSAFAEAELSSTASRHARDIATAEPWSGTESVHDASLRMLNDAHKPLKVRGGTRGSGPSAQLPRSIDTGRRNKVEAGTRLANARDRSGLYSSLKESDIDEQERQKRFQDLKDRFSPHGRTVVPGTIQGLASLANERIENAISRGQFKNLPNRGKNVERDYNASNPFLDTTEYFMNKIIQKQEIVPPWIEKQQELVAAASKFRSRLRNDWKRHAARMIASKGGSLQEQMRKAEAYAQAELIVNPLRTKKEVLNTVDEGGHLSQISLSGELKTSSHSTADDATVVHEITAEQITAPSSDAASSSDAQPKEGPQAAQIVTIPISSHAVDPSSSPLPTPPRPPTSTLHLFRDSSWQSIELAYHTAAIADLNSKTRSYNLQAPDLAKKPYFSLARELDSCFADVAPQLAGAIRERAAKPVSKTQGFGDSLAGGNGGVMDRLVGQPVRVRDERVGKRYGFRQFWNEMWEAKGGEKVQ